MFSLFKPGNYILREMKCACEQTYCQTKKNYVWVSGFASLLLPGNNPAQ